MNSYQTVNAAFAASSLSKAAAVRFGVVWEALRARKNPSQNPHVERAALRKEGAHNPFTAEEVRQSYENTSYLAPAPSRAFDYRVLARDQSEDRPARYIVVARELGGELVYYVQGRGGRRVTSYTPHGDVAYVWAAIREIAALTVPYGAKAQPFVDYDREHTGDSVSNVTPEQVRALAARLGYTV